MAQKEKNKPSLNLSMVASKYGRDLNLDQAQTKMFSDSKDYLYVGLNYTMPLGLTTSSDVRRGYDLLVQSQVLAEQSRQRNEKITWKNTYDQVKSLETQYHILKNLEVTQKEKSDLEREKYNNGRSTTYQVLNFEQDYLNARNQKNNLELQIRNFLNSLDLYKDQVQ